MKCWLWLLPLAGTLFAAPELTPTTFEQQLRPFLKNHCTACHGEKKQKAKRRFDRLVFPIPDDDTLTDFQDVLDVLNLGDMPPEDEPQPDGTEVARVVAWLTAALEQAYAERSPSNGETVLRRLNRREYRHTIADLFHLDTRGFDPTENFPADEKVHHLDNQGHALVTSGFLLDQYVSAAEHVIEKALPALERPQQKEWNFTGGFLQQPELDNRRIRMEQARLLKFGQAKSKAAQDRVRKASQGRLDATMKASLQVPRTLRLYEHPRSDRHMGSYAPLADLAAGVPDDGHYLISIKAEALHRNIAAEKNYMRTDLSKPFLLAVVAGDQRFGDLHLPQAVEPELARFALKDDGIQTYEARIWLHEGTTPRFIFPNGSGRMRSAFIQAGRELLAGKGRSEVPTEEAFIYGMEHAKLPQIVMHRVFLQGPSYDTWPNKSAVELLGGRQFVAGKTKANLETVLSRLYRRPVRREEVEQILKVIRIREQHGVSAFDAYRDGLKAALCSPNFLYLEEQGDPLDGYAIASRLSYFLWSSMPDETLLSLAKQGTLSDPQVRMAQAERMLRDPRSDRFIDGFLDSWLTLDQLGDTPPDRSLFREYYQDNLAVAMRRETQLFVRHILDKNLSMDLFLESDFTFVNPALARLYHMDVELPDEGFHKVSTAKGPRGGLLGHASVLTVTANGVDTSPVVRGVWLLENILGTPPTPPPPDVEPLDPDIRGAQTIRDQLEKHRNNPTCAECHRKIDPLGFALENFDAIGRYRGRYKQGGKIDASGILPNGKGFDRFKAFTLHLAKEKPKVTRAITEKMMSYALGRSVEISDRPEVDRILEDLDVNDRRFGHLIKLLVASPAFTRP